MCSENKGTHISCAVTAQMIRAFVFAYMQKKTGFLMTRLECPWSATIMTHDSGDDVYKLKAFFQIMYHKSLCMTSYV